METLGWLTIVPPLITIAVAFATRKILLSLLIGIVTGTFLSSGYNPVLGLQKAVSLIFKKSELSHFVSWSSFYDSWNLFVVLFCLILGSLVGLFYQTGGAKAYGDWAMTRIRSKRGASLATMGLGFIIFFDDYFNCLTVGAVMRPVSDRFKLSRAKLAYLIDSTTAPVCILAPISTWVIEVMTQLKTAGIGSKYPGDPFTIFIDGLFFNSYAWLTLLLVALIAFTGKDFGPMKDFEERAAQGDFGAVEADDNEKKAGHFKRIGQTKDAQMVDLALPLTVFVGCIFSMMLYSGGFVLFGGPHSLIQSFQNMHVARSLCFGGFAGLIFSTAYYMIRQLLTPAQLLATFSQSIRVMLPVVATLVLAWTMGAVISDELKTGLFLSQLMSGHVAPWLLPVLIFALSCVISFATGTSWGTFAIMIPIAVPMAFSLSPDHLVPMIAAVLAGAIYGDHSSPISDTTILSSVGSGCRHMDHVITQAPYAGFVASVCLVCFGLGGWLVSWNSFAAGLISLGVGIVLLSVPFQWSYLTSSPKYQLPNSSMPK